MDVEVLDEDLGVLVYVEHSDRAHSLPWCTGSGLQVGMR
jgi:hypothetical protein